MKAERHQNGTGGLHGFYAIVLLIAMAVMVTACEGPPRRDFAADNHCTKDLWQALFVCRDRG